MKHRKKGFTLIELIISMTILAILLSMVVVIFRATHEGVSKASALQNVVDTSRVLIERMQNEISAAFFDPQGKANLVGIPSSGARLKTHSAGDELYFCIPLKHLESSDITEVGYWQHTDGNMMRHYEGIADFDFTTGTADDPLGLIIHDLTFEYFDGTTYQRTWDSRPEGAEEGRAPKAIRISFTVTDDDTKVTRKFETVVRVTSGKRY